MKKLWWVKPSYTRSFHAQKILYSQNKLKITSLKNNNYHIDTDLPQGILNTIRKFYCRSSRKKKYIYIYNQPHISPRSKVMFWGPIVLKQSERRVIIFLGHSRFWTWAGNIKYLLFSSPKWRIDELEFWKEFKSKVRNFALVCLLYIRESKLADYGKRSSYLRK